MSKFMTKDQLLAKIAVLEILSDVYSRTDWVEYLAVQKKLRALDIQLLNMYNHENREFLQSHPEAS